MKRARGTGTQVIVRGGRTRPIQKELVMVNITATSVATTSQTLSTFTQPGTIVGLRWSISDLSAIATSTQVAWVIMIIRESVATPTMSLGSGNDIVNPVQDVLAFGVGHTVSTAGTAGPQVHNWEGNTKTMRKVQGGDQLAFLTLSNGVASDNILACIQYFIKSWYPMSLPNSVS